MGIRRISVGPALIDLGGRRFSVDLQCHTGSVLGPVRMPNAGQIPDMQERGSGLPRDVYEYTCPRLAWQFPARLIMGI